MCVFSSELQKIEESSLKSFIAYVGAPHKTLHVPLVQLFLTQPGKNKYLAPVAACVFIRSVSHWASFGSSGISQEALNSTEALALYTKLCAVTLKCLQHSAGVPSSFSNFHFSKLASFSIAV